MEDLKHMSKNTESYMAIDQAIMENGKQEIKVSPTQ